MFWCLLIFVLYVTCIQSILLGFPQENLELQKRDQNEWEKVFQHLLQTLRRGITLCIEQGLLSEREKEIFFMSGVYIAESIDIVVVIIWS